MAEACVLEQCGRRCDRTIRAASIHGHDVRRQRVQEQAHIGRIVGQRRDRVRVIRERDQPHLPARTLLQERGDLGARL